MDQIEGLRAFRAVARHRSFTAAAAESGAPQPVLSRRVAALETALGARLFDRTSRSVDLTEAGARILDHADEVVSRWERIRAVCQGETDPLVLGIPPRLDPQQLAVIRRGLAHHEVRVVEASRGERESGWQAGRLDIAVLTGAPSPQGIIVELGVAFADAVAGDTFSLAWLRRARTGPVTRPRVLQLGEEDDTPMVRDPLRRLAHQHGLRADQVAVVLDHTETLTRVHEHGDGWLCSAIDARAAQLEWTPIRGLALTRDHQVRVRPGRLQESEVDRLGRRLARALGGTSPAVRGDQR